jgi:hypothetical protein
VEHAGDSGGNSPGSKPTSDGLGARRRNQARR